MLGRYPAIRAAVAIGAAVNVVLLAVSAEVASWVDGPARWVLLGVVSVLFALPPALVRDPATPVEGPAAEAVVAELAGHLASELAAAAGELEHHDVERVLDAAAVTFARLGFDRAEILTVDEHGHWEVIRTVDYLPTTRTFTPELIPVPTDGTIRQLEATNLAALCWQGRGVAELLAYRVWTTRNAHRLPGMLGAVRSMTSLVERSLETCGEADPSARAA